MFNEFLVGQCLWHAGHMKPPVSRCFASMWHLMRCLTFELNSHFGHWKVPSVISTTILSITASRSKKKENSFTGSHSEEVSGLKTQPGIAIKNQIQVVKWFAKCWVQPVLILIMLRGQFTLRQCLLEAEFLSIRDFSKFSCTRFIEQIGGSDICGCLRSF